MFTSKIFLFTNIVYLIFHSNDADSLKKVIVLFRHGDRSPYATYKNDPYNNETYWPQGKGQLTQLGMSQEYHLGLFLKEQYVKKNKLLNSMYKRNEIYIRSTDYDRTLMSAQSVLNGLYPPNGTQIWRDQLDWQPIPVHTRPKDEDKLLGQTKCKGFTDAVDKLKKSKNFTDTSEKYKDFIKKINDNAGENYKTIFDLQDVCDNNFCNMQHQRTYKWFNKTDLEKCKTIVQPYAWWVRYGSDKRAKYSLGLFFANISEIFYNAKNNISPRKATLFSAHDSTVAATLYGLGVPYVAQPSYTAAVIMELWLDKKEWKVKVFYRTLLENGTNRTVSIKVKGCSNSDFCTFEEFNKRLDKVKFTEDDYQDICMETKIKKLSMATILAIVASIIICLLASVLVLLCLKRRRPTANFYTAVGDDA